MALKASNTQLTGQRGNPSPGPEQADRPRTSINYDGGSYVREGNHDGEDKSLKGTRKHGLEIEITTMTPNTPNTRADFPLLAVGISAHTPGRIKLEGKKVFDSIVERGYPIGKVLADRAYLPGSVAEELQGPLRKQGFELVFDYKKTELGITDYFADAIQVGGQWYLSVMPDDLINARTLHQKTMESIKRKSPETKAKREMRKAREAEADGILQDRYSQRKNYLFTRKGRPDAEGFQRFFYPDPNNYLNVNKITGEILAPIATKTLTIPADRGLKYGQLLAHESAEWKAWFGMRSIIEGFNGYVKDPTYEGIEDAGRRRARGNTFAYLASVMALVSANLRKIFRFLQNSLSPKPLTAKTRAKRRTLPGWAEANQATLAISTETVPPPQ